MHAPDPALPSPITPAPDTVVALQSEAVVPVNAAERVKVAPPGEWITTHAVDEEFRPEVTGAATVLLFDQQHHAARHERYLRVVRRLETIQAVHEAAQWRLEFDPATQHVTIHSLTVRRGGATSENAHAARFRFLQREENLERLIIDGLVTVVVLLDDVRVGDTLDASFTVQTKPRILPENFWLLAPVPNHLPLRAFHLTVRFPAERAMQWKGNEKAERAPVIRELDGEVEWSWHLEHLRAVEPEPNVPPWHFNGHWLQVSDCASWGDVASGLTTVWREELDDPELRRVAEEIAQAEPQPAGRIARALGLVQDDIRYLSVNVEVGGQIPSSPGVVLKRRFGDCKDKAFLLAHLLRRLGIGARPVLVHAQLCHEVQRFLPMPDAFNHAIVEFELEGRRRCADATLLLQGGPPSARVVPDFGFGLPLGPGVETLERLPAPPDTENRYELRETFVIDTSGQASRLRVLVTASGTDAENLRRRIALDGFDAFARKREQFYQQFFPRLTREGVLESSDDRGRNEFLLAEQFSLPDALISPPGAAARQFQFRAHLIQSLLAFPDARTRRAPLALPFPCEVDYLLTIESAGLTATRTNSEKVRGEGTFQLLVNTTAAPGRLTVRYRLRILSASVSPERFSRYRNLVQDAWPRTFLTVDLPPGFTAPRRKRGSLLATPRILPPPASASPIADETLLAHEPAAALRSLPVASQSTRFIKPRQDAGPAREPAPPPLSLETLPPPKRVEPAPADPQTHRRQRRRRSSQPKSDKTYLLLLIIFGVALTVILFAIRGR